jgi:hypothetical protein
LSFVGPGLQTPPVFAAALAARRRRCESQQYRITIDVDMGYPADTEHDLATI